MNPLTVSDYRRIWNERATTKIEERERMIKKHEDKLRKRLAKDIVDNDSGLKTILSHDIKIIYY